MTRESLFTEVATRLYREGLLCEENYASVDDCIHDAAIYIEKEFDDYTILRGEMVEMK